MTTGRLRAIKILLSTASRLDQGETLSIARELLAEVETLVAREVSAESIERAAYRLVARAALDSASAACDDAHTRLGI